MHTAAPQNAVEFAGAGGQKHGPRGLDVRPVYGAYRPEMMDDNRAEGMLAYGAGLWALVEVMR